MPWLEIPQQALNKEANTNINTIYIYIYIHILKYQKIEENMSLVASNPNGGGFSYPFPWVASKHMEGGKR